jgi:recombination DNA repair RAD52 pathway protein
LFTNLTHEQYEQLMKPLNPSRVAKRQQAGRNLSYLEAWDVKAHLIRIFGFGGWSWDVLAAEQAFESEKDGKWNVGYRVVGRLMIPNLDCTYTEAAVGSATLPQRGEAHDMAVKTAESDAIKRAAINLGTQFGLSLYNNGDLKDVVKATLIVPTLAQTETEK